MKRKYTIPLIMNLFIKHLSLDSVLIIELMEAFNHAFTLESALVNNLITDTGIQHNVWKFSTNIFIGSLIFNERFLCLQ